VGWDVIFAWALLIVPLALLYGVWVTHVDDYTYDPYDQSTFDVYLPDDGIDKGLIVQSVEIPTTTEKSEPLKLQKTQTRFNFNRWYKDY
jgi:hypothetical protein